MAASEIDRPCQELSHITMEVVDWKGPIVETSFHRPIDTTDDAEAVIREAIEFMEQWIRPRFGGAFFLTCYDGLKISREVAIHLQNRFLEFNRAYSKGDARYAFNTAAKAFVIATAIKASEKPNFYTGRTEALIALRALIRTCA